MKKLILSFIVTSGIVIHSIIAQTATYKVDPAKSTLGWSARKVTEAHKGTIEISSGTFVVADKKITGGNFELNIAALTVTDLKDADSNGKLTGHLKSDDFFSTDKFPKSIFVITEVKSKGGNNYSITGSLTIKGITNTVSFPATIKLDGKTLTAIAVITVDRTKFNIKFRSSNFFENLGDKAIYDDFSLMVKLVAVQ